MGESEREKERREGGTCPWGQELQKRGERQRQKERQAEKQKVREKGRDRQTEKDRERKVGLFKKGNVVKVYNRCSNDYS